MRSKLADVQERLIDWLVTPANERVPSTKGEMGESLGVSQATFRRYENLPEVQREVSRRLRSMNVNPERVQVIVDDMYAMATDERLAPKDRLAAQKMYLQYIGQFQTAGKRVEEDTPVSELTDEELAEVVKLHAVEG